MKKISTKNYALIICLLASFLPPFVGSSINLALPSIANEFTMDAVMLGWVPTAYLLSLAIFLVPFGRIADIYGRKKIFTYGIIIFTIASFLAVFSTSGTMLILFRIIQGIGSSMIFGNLFAIITSVFPTYERGKALGITITGAFFGLFLGPVFGGFLTQYFGWKSIFLVNVPIGLITILSVIKLEEEWVGAPGEKFDLIGSVILGISLVTAIYGLSILPEESGFFMIIGGLVGIIVFYQLEKRIESPVLNVNIFKNKNFTFNVISAFINYCAAFPIIFLLSLYIQYIKGFNPQNAGLILAVQPIIMTVFSPFAGKLSDKIEPRIVASFGMAFITIALIIFTFLTKNTSMLSILVGLIVLGIGYALFSSPNINAAISSVEEKYYGVASATLTTMRVIGQMFGMGIIILIFTFFMGDLSIKPENYGLFLVSAKISFIIFAFLCILGCVIPLITKKIE